MVLPSLFNRLCKFYEKNQITKTENLNFLNYNYRFSKSLFSFLNLVGFTLPALTPEIIPKHHIAKLKPCMFVEVLGTETLNEKKSRSNMNEIIVCGNLVKFIKQMLSYNQTIAVLSPYSEQVRALRENFQREGISENFLNLQIETVDSFKSNEADVVIISTVRGKTSLRGSWDDGTDPDIGFLSDHRRLSLLMTRGKVSTILVGHYVALTRDKLWGRLIDILRGEKSILHHSSIFKENGKLLMMNKKMEENLSLGFQRGGSNQHFNIKTEESDRIKQENENNKRKSVHSNQLEGVVDDTNFGGGYFVF